MAIKKICSKYGQALLVCLLLFIGLFSPRTVSLGQTGSETPVPASPTATASATATATPTATASATATSTRTPTATITPTFTRTPSPTPTPTYTLTPTPFPTGQPINSGWSKPLAFDRNGWFPDITTDASGRLYVAWSNNVINLTNGPRPLREGYDVVLYTSSADGQTWDPISEIAAMKETVLGNVDVTRPSLLVDPSGVFHMTYHEGLVYYANVPVQLLPSARYWTKAFELTSIGMGYFSRLALDSKNRLHAIYTQDVPAGDCLICYHVFHRVSENGGKDWSKETDISKIPTGSAKPQVLIDDQDNIQVVWESGRGGTLGQLVDPTNVMYTASYDGGQTWTTPLVIGAPGADRSKNITIGQDGKGQLVMAWWSLPEDLIYFQVSKDRGRSWSAATRMPDVWGEWAVMHGVLDDYSMATDSAGNIHLVLVGRLSATDTQLHLLHLVWNGSTWSKPEAIMSYNGDVPEWPRIVISNGNQLNVVWFVRGRDFIWTAAGESYQVYYARALYNSPAKTPVAWPALATPTLVPPTPETTIQPPTALPTVPTLNATLDETSMDERTYTEAGQLSIVALSVVPALFVVGILLIFLVIRRR